MNSEQRVYKNILHIHEVDDLNVMQWIMDYFGYV